MGNTTAEAARLQSRWIGVICANKAGKSLDFCGIQARQRQTSVEEGRHRVSGLGGWRLVAREQKTSNDADGYFFGDFYLETELIRKCVRDNFTSDDLLKLFPPDLSLDLQSNLILLLQKYQNQWKEEMSREQHPVQRTSVSYHVKTIAPPSFTSFPSSVISTPLWPHQDDPVTNFNHNDLGASTPVIVDNTVASLSPMLLQRDVSPPDNLRNLPNLKSMTWTMEKSNSAPGDRVAVINLKLQDYTKSPSGEIDVKFQLTKDTLEAMLTSLAYISEQLSNVAGTSSEPAQKKQKP
ncbi:hypothetical protein EZV62_007746 [Acer yangbiense]|uniref:COMM domain-containing protein n=1 Tax=Acer yangbiense TaxID=1000413 RepID=A0A5C7IBI5_9ROSI|nr:hypothetical protein EZV62_007746 [Acer yangbiense]